ncbi:MAG: FAD-binding oxidoreductase [Thermomicrobiales bacterium]|nr:FAD-binding oxidoreductase [Thermomicrobiales bacterium]
MTPDTSSAQTIDFTFSTVDIAIARLQERLRGSVLTPGHADFASASAAWVANTVHNPALIVLAETAQDVVEAVRYAREHDLPVAVQATGHGAVAPIEGGLLINTSRMLGYAIDPETRTARVEAGVKWAHIIEDLHKHRLAGLCGSTTDVGIVGYTLGGGTGWFSRRHGFAADKVIAFDLVTAAGELIHVNGESHPDLFWAVRGGGGNFGIVTAIEFGLIELESFFGGAVMYDLADAPAVFRAYTEWVQTLPESVTSSIAILRMPPLPMVPEPIRGRAFITIRAVGPVTGGEFLIEPMRQLAPVIMDTFGCYPFNAIDLVSSDPVDPMPELSTSHLLSDIRPETIDAVLELAGEGKDFPVLMLEFRHIDGAARKASLTDSAANRHDAPWIMLALAVPFAPEIVPAIEAAHTAVAKALAPVRTGYTFLNFVMKSDDPTDLTRTSFTPGIYAWLQRVKKEWDPTNVFRFGRNIRPEA